jgi:hypothetical protein
MGRAIPRRSFPSGVFLGGAANDGACFGDGPGKKEILRPTRVRIRIGITPWAGIRILRHCIRQRAPGMRK